ncbi:DUF1684 domain-containing protein [Christiangramia sabulilitoris]|uniref:DUF1684 domain-containing protein n=1 Tax=Christiangramia sabulilitoris TaxID=2583991 RepID=A0A550HZ19_9FLAO|nr:DUF1684 domain-containing protein [Christiangramia sabulilitoris]TRO63979.1 DUF1684 domain-containing protein [Christiangramia sabulilitoris]
MQRYLYVLSLILVISVSGSLTAQESRLIEDAEDFQSHLDLEFADPEKSPLEDEDLMDFQGLDFFEIDPQFIVAAEFVRTPAEPPFAMKTSTERMPVYVKYGELYFTLKGEDFKLNVYQNQELVQDPDYFDYLFLPFTDRTNGKSTYGGGRYLDLRIPETNEVIIDFNQAYNPYCAYSGKYSCPIPPAENDLEIEIFAGVKAFNNY